MTRAASLRVAARCALLTAVAWAAHPTAAMAQGTSADAEELFKQGRAALDAKDYATACQKLAASLQIERAVGTLMSLAKCEEAASKLASARQHWQEAADYADVSNDRLNRGAACRAKFAELDKRVPRLTVRLAGSAPKSAVVTRDGVALSPAMLGSPMPIDPGTHAIEASAAGYATRAVSVELKEGETKDIEAAPGPATTAAASIAGTPAAAPGAASPTTVTATAPPATTSTAPSAGASNGMNGLFWGGVVVAGAGAVAGLAFGAVAMGKTGSLASECPDHACSSASAQSDYNAAKSMALASNAGFAVAGAGVVLGVIGLLTSKHATTEKPAVSFWIGPGSGGVRGTF